MSSRSSVTRLAGKRVSALAALTTVIGAAAAVLSATPAAATTTAATVTIPAGSQNTNHQSNTGVVNLTVDYTPTTADAPLRIIIFSGPDAASAPNPTGALCAAPSGGTTTCPINNTTPGTDTFEVYADNNTNGTFDGGDIASAVSTAIFSDVPAAVSISPTSTESTAGTCQLFTVHATDAEGQPSVGRDLTFTVNETLANPANPGTITFYNIAQNNPPDCDTPIQTSAPASPATATSPAIATDGTGTVVIGVAASDAGSGTVKVSYSATVNNSASVTWTAGGADAVTSLAITAPSNVTQYVNTTAKFTITATDHNGDPVQGVAVNYETDSASPDSHAPTVCGTTNHAGQVTCTITNGPAVPGPPPAGGPGTDTITYWVDNGLPGPHTSGPDANEPQAVATVIYRSLPAVSASTLTCVQQLAGPQHNAPVSDCTVPTTQSSATFTETLANQGQPVVGAVVEFHVTGAQFGGDPATIADSFQTTDATGAATFTVSDPTAVSGDFVHVTTFLGLVPESSASVTWQKPAASLISLTPPLQSVTKGSVVTVGVQISDQFGNPVSGARTIFFNVVGPSAPQSGPLTTSATGAATVSYTSNATTIGEDKIMVSDTTLGDSVSSNTAFAELINGSTTASAVTVDTSGNGTASTCPSTGTPQNTNLVIGISVTQVCALVKNSNNEVLAGKTVTFSVDIGQVSGTNPIPSTATKTFVATTNPNGIATAFVASTESGTQTVTATADSTSGTGTLTYALPTLDKARNITVSPPSATITAGNSQKFTWTVTDQYGNPIAGASITYTQTGPGLPGNSSSGLLVTANDGTASLVLNTSATDNGAGSVVATLQQPSAPIPNNQCTKPANDPVTATTAGNCTVAATYTVVGAAPPTSISLVAATGVTKGHQETITATLKNADGSPSANQVVRFLVTGANGLIGSAQSNASGVAIFSYRATHAGVDAVSAYVDLNNDQVQEGNEPGKHTKAIIGGVKESPTMRLTTSHGSVTVHVVTHPLLPRDLVTYYVKRYGKYVRIGTSHAGIRGHAAMTFFYPKGVVRRFKAKVAGIQGIKGAKTHPKTITVR